MQQDLSHRFESRPPFPLTAIQLLNQLQRKYRHLGSDERFERIAEEVAEMDIPEELKKKVIDLTGA